MDPASEDKQEIFAAFKALFDHIDLKVDEFRQVIKKGTDRIQQIVAQNLQIVPRQEANKPAKPDA